MHRSDVLGGVHRPARPSAKRRLLLILAASALSLSVNVSVAAAPAAASCQMTWTATIVGSKSINVPNGTYTSTVKYRLEFDTCKLGVYTRINVQTFTNTFKITSAPLPNYIDYEGVVLKTCSGLGAGCILYPGPQAYRDGRVYNHVGPGTYSRTASPNVYFPYHRNAATWDYWTTSGNPWYIRFVYQFIANGIYAG